MKILGKGNNTFIAELSVDEMSIVTSHHQDMKKTFSLNTLEIGCEISVTEIYGQIKQLDTLQNIGRTEAKRLRQIADQIECIGDTVKKI